MFTLLAIMMLIAATVAWFLIQRLQERPWTQHGVLPGSHDDFTSSAPKVGLWAFLCVVSSVFLIFTAAYFMRMDSTHGGVASSMVMHAWHPVGEPPILWFNTLILLGASVMFELARRAATVPDIARTRSMLGFAAVLTLAFLSGQVVAWQIVASEIGGPDRSNAAFSFFVLLTAVHGLHLLGGLFVLTRGIARLWQGFDATNLLAVDSIRQTIALCATYWHFLAIVWLGLFLLLLST